MEQTFWYITCAVLVPGTLWASWIDYAERRVPNWLNLALLLAGFAVQTACFGAGGAWTAFLGMLVGFGLLIVPWMMHGMGAGDVKLMAAIGAWLGPMLTLYSFSVGAVIGGIAAVVMILSTGRLRMAGANLAVILNKCSSTRTMFTEYGGAKTFGETSQLLPYGVPLTAGTLLVLGFKMLGGWGV